MMKHQKLLCNAVVTVRPGHHCAFSDAKGKNPYHSVQCGYLARQSKHDDNVIQNLNAEKSVRVYYIMS